MINKVSILSDSCYNTMQKVQKRQTMKAHFGEGSEPLTPKRIKKSALVKEFQEFKQQIQQFEDNNEAALNRIRENYSFKKKQIIDKRNKTQQILDRSISSVPNPQINFNIDQPKLSSNRNQLPLQVNVSQQATNKVCLQYERQFDKIQESKSIVESPSSFAEEQDQITPQCQRYRFIKKKQSPNNSEESSGSHERINYVINSGIQNNLTEQSNMMISDKNDHFQMPLHQQLVWYKIENQNLSASLCSLQQQYLKEELENKTLKKSIKTTLQASNEKVKLNNFKKNVKSLIQNAFYAISEDYFQQKMTQIQRHIRKVENKVKRLGFCVIAWGEQKEDMKKRIKRTQLVHKVSQNENRTRAGSVGVSLELNQTTLLQQCHDPQCKEKEKLSKKEIKELQQALSSTKNHLQELTISLSKIKQNENNLTNQIQAKISIIEDLTFKMNLESNVHSEQVKQLLYKIDKLELKEQEQQRKSQKQEESCKLLELQFNKQKLKASTEYEELQTELKTIQQEYNRQLQQISHLESQVSENRKIILDKEMEMFSLNSKIRTLENEVQYKSKKIEGLEEIISKFHIQQTSSEMSPQKSSLLNKNSIINIQFQESRESFEDWSQEHIPPPQQFKQLDSNLSIIDLGKGQIKRLSESEIQRPKVHQDIEDAFNNALHAEIDKLRRQVDTLTKENHYYLDQLEELSKMFNKAEEEKSFQQKKAEQASSRILSLEKKLKLSHYQLLLTQKSQLGSQNQNKLSQLESLNYSQSYLNNEDKDLADNDNDVRGKLEQLMNQVELIHYQEQMQKEQNNQLIKNLQLELQYKDQQLKLYEDEIQHLTFQLNQLGQQKNDRKDSLLLEEGNQLSLKHCKLSHIETKEDKREYRESLSFRLSVDPSEYFFPKIQNTQNIADVFKEDEALEEKMKKGKSTRNDQIKMFEKTTHYIKSLKDSIIQKSQQIKELEGEIKFLKSKDQNILGSLDDKAMVRLSQSFESHNFQSLNDSQSQGLATTHKACRSVKLPSLKKIESSSRQVQAEKQFLMEENKILLRQIEILHEELSRSEKQQTSLIKLKDFYKEELKKQSELYNQKLREKDGCLSQLQSQGRLNADFIDKLKCMKERVQVLKDLSPGKRGENEMDEADRLLRDLFEKLDGLKFREHS